MNIAIVISRFPPKWLAGAEIATYNIAKNLAEKGYEVHAITSFDNGLETEEIIDGFHLHRIDYPRLRIIGLMFFWTKIFFEVRKINPDIVHIQTLQVGIIGIFIKKLLKKPFIVWGRGSDVYIVSNFKLLRPIIKTVLKNATFVLALTESMKNEMKNIHNREINVIPNGIDIKKYSDVINTQNNDCKRIIFVGRLTAIKGVTNLIEAIELTKNKYSNLELIIVGDGEDRKKIEGLVHKHKLENIVNFVGKVPNEQIPRYMASSDIFVLPSLSEGFPNTVLEAMASGLPIISTNVGGLPDIIENGVNGYLVEPNNPKMISENIIALLENKQLMKKISENNRKRAKEFSWESVIIQLENLYKNIGLKTLDKGAL